uniref:Uncharacterized protein n=1 Tax=Cucumis melo TaxID=3656 RepID=A0A9I9E763_CUCME
GREVFWNEEEVVNYKDAYRVKHVLSLPLHASQIIRLETRFLNKIYASMWILNVWKMIYEIFINYMTEILSLRLENTVCTLVEIEFPSLIGCLSLLKLPYRLQYVFRVGHRSRQIHVKKSVVRRFHAIFWSKLAGSPGGGVTGYANHFFIYFAIF